MKLELVAWLGLAFGYTAARQLNGIGGFKEYGREAERLHLRANTHHLMATVTEDYINRKLHEQHMDGLAMRNDKGLAWRQVFLA